LPAKPINKAKNDRIERKIPGLQDSIVKCKTELAVCQYKLDSTHKTIPVEPQKADTSNWYFDLKFSAVNFPQLKPFTATLFQVLPEYTSFNTGFYSTKWKSIKITEHTPGVKYIIHVTHEKNGRNVSYHIPVKPVFEGRNYEDAMELFKADFKIYQTEIELLEKRKKVAEDKLKQYEDSHRRGHFVQHKINNNTEETTAYLNKAFTPATPNGVIRSFNINLFGIWNCDLPIQYYKRKEYTQVTPMMADGNIISQGEMYVSNTKLRCVWKFNGQQRNKVELYENNEYVVWIIDEHNQLHYTKVLLTKNNWPDKKKLSLTMQTVSNVPKNAAELKKIIGV
jgi:hypothetical protein